MTSLPALLLVDAHRLILELAVRALVAKVSALPSASPNSFWSAEASPTILTTNSPKAIDQAPCGIDRRLSFY